jgi:hypothetical protein
LREPPGSGPWSSLARIALHGSMDFRWAEKKILRDLGVGRAFVSGP